MNATKHVWKIALLGSILLAGSQAAGAQSLLRAQTFDDRPRPQQEPEAVMLVDVFFGPTNRNADGGWHAGNARVLPCAAPSKPSILDGASSTILVTDARGRPVYSRPFRNPRLILVEDPTQEATLLREVEFTMRVPFSREMTHLQFFEKSRENKEPSFVVDLSKAVKAFLANGGHDQYAPCQIPFEGLIVEPGDADGSDVDNGVAPRTVLAIVRANPGAAVDAALAAGITMRDVRGFIRSHRKTLTRLGVSRKEINEYMRLFKRKSGPRHGLGQGGRFGRRAPKPQSIAPQVLIDRLFPPRNPIERKR